MRMVNRYGLKEDTETNISDEKLAGKQTDWNANVLDCGLWVRVGTQSTWSAISTEMAGRDGREGGGGGVSQAPGRPASHGHARPARRRAPELRLAARRSVSHLGPSGSGIMQTHTARQKPRRQMELLEKHAMNQPRNLLLDIPGQLIILNPHPDGALDFAPPGDGDGGGGGWGWGEAPETPPFVWAPVGRSEKWQETFDSSPKIIKKYFSNFYLSSILKSPDISKCQFSNLREFPALKIWNYSSWKETEKYIALMYLKSVFKSFWGSVNS